MKDENFPKIFIQSTRYKMRKKYRHSFKKKREKHEEKSR